MGLDAQRWRTHPASKDVLIAVHSVTCGTRLRDIVPLFDGDGRVRLVFTAPPDVFSDGGDAAGP